MRKSGGKCYDLLLSGWLIGWLGWLFRRGLCRMRPCVGGGQEVLRIRCQQEQGGPGPANLQLLWHSPKGGPRVGVSPLSQLVIQAGLMLLWCYWCAAPSDSRPVPFCCPLSLFHCLCHRWWGPAAVCWCLLVLFNRVCGAGVQLQGLYSILRQKVPGICLRRWEPMLKRARVRERIM